MTPFDAIDTANEPYPGLRSFRREETHIFFGREQTVSEMVDRLARHRFLAVTGYSGSGKSSLVRVGLLDALDRGMLVKAGSDWAVADFAPGGQPFFRMTAALAEAVGGDRLKHGHDLGLLEAKLARGPQGLIEWLDEIEVGPRTNLLLLVDQFEEIFRYRHGQSGDDVDAFVQLLLASARAPNRNIYVVITMRSDFLGDCARFGGLAEQINHSQFLTPRLTREQCREAIEGPAGVYDGRVEAALTTRMLNDMAGNPDQLPLMQHVLMLLWQEARKRVGGDGRPELTLADYERQGGIGTGDWEAVSSIERETPSLVRRLFGGKRNDGATKDGDAGPHLGALSGHADRVLAELTPEQQRLAGRLFRALTQSDGPAGRAVRRPVTLEQAAAIADALQSDLIPVIETFRAAGRHFLTPLPPAPLTANTVIDISHESFIRQWGKLRGWVEEESHSAETYRSIERGARQWKRGLAALIPKLDLAVARKWLNDERPNAAWAQRYGDAFDLAMTYLRTSQRHHLWRRILATSLAIVSLSIVLLTATAAVALLTGSLSYLNPADEWTDFGVAPLSELQFIQSSPTPLTIPGGRVIATGALEAALERGTLDGVPFLTIDVLRRDNPKLEVPKSQYIEYAGDYGAFGDQVQQKLKDELAKLTGNDPDMPLVFFCLGARCWESYNAALRAIKLGYTRVYWYRGGLASWRAAHQTLISVAYDRVPAVAIRTGMLKASLEARDMIWPNADYYHRRGTYYIDTKQYDEAISELTRAITLSPEHADAYYRRGKAYVSKQAFAEARSDFSKAIALSPSETDYLLSRGFVNFYVGDFKQAAADFQSAGGTHPYSMLFRYLARARDGDATAAVQLETEAASQPTKVWPYPVVELLTGKISPEVALEAAKTSNQVCEAHFYIGEWHLLRGETPPAVSQLTAAKSKCPLHYEERIAAIADLARIRP
jgi:PQQ-dependent catabolism-associated CXXCW motif protein